MTRSNANLFRPGFTLIELLAVAVLLALAASVTVASLSRAGGSPAAAARRLAAVDARARIDARVDGARTISLDADRSDTNAVRVEPVAGAGETVPAGVHTLGTALELRVGGEPVDRIVIDSLGRSTDYTAVLRADGGHTTALRVAGLTGWAAIEHEQETRP